MVKQTDYFQKMLAFSIPLAILVAGVSLVGIFSDNFYAQESPNWQVQSLGQDIIDLVLVVPVLLVFVLLASKIRLIGAALWAGVILYLIYTFVIYSFDVHFNKLFIAYCLILGLSFYAFLHFIYVQLNEAPQQKIENRNVRKGIGTYFIVVSVLFYMLWLTDVIPAITSGTTPKILLDAGLATNPVHVIDLAVVLPGIFITGLLLLKNKKLGLILTPVMLMFFILMDITIASLNAMMQQKGLDGSVYLTLVMVALALLSFILLIWYFRNARN
jgi:hypothetical protein